MTAPRRLRVPARELPYLALFGIAGLAFVQWFYFLAIHRLAIGIALLIQYLAPLLVALWARFALHEPVRRRIWFALALALAGLGADRQHLRRREALPRRGRRVRARARAFTYALYILLAEHASATVDAVSLLAWGFGFGSLFWAIIAPWWIFPGHRVGRRTRRCSAHLAATTCPVWALMTWMVVLGTILPFFLLVSALRHLPRDARRDHRDARAGGRTAIALALAQRVARRRSSSPAPASCCRDPARPDGALAAQRSGEARRSTRAERLAASLATKRG